MPTKRPSFDPLGNCSLSRAMDCIRNGRPASGVLPAAPFTTPMPAVKPPKGRLVEVDNHHLEEALIERGVVWPLGGFAPGDYLQTCSACGKRHTADKRSIRCLPCELTLAIGAAKDDRDRFEEGVAEGRRRATQDVVRALGVVEAPASALGLVRERIEGALNAPAYAAETLELAVREIDGWIGARP